MATCTTHVSTVCRKSHRFTGALSSSPPLCVASCSRFSNLSLSLSRARARLKRLVLTFSIDDLCVQTAESLRAEEASILAELAELSHDAGSAAPAETAPTAAQAAAAVLPQVVSPPRGFGMGTGQLLWGNSRAARGPDQQRNVWLEQLDNCCSRGHAPSLTWTHQFCSFEHFFLRA